MPGLMRLLLCFALAAQITSASAAPVRPADDSVVLGTVPLSRAGTSPEFASLAADPENLELALKAARASIEQGRANADPRSYGQAQAALMPWWSDPKAPRDVRMLRAVIRQANHEFASAAMDLDTIIDEEARDAQARLSRAFLRMTTGDIAGAAADCRALPPPAGRLVRAICMSRAAALSGKGEEARLLLSRTLSGSSRPGDPMALFGAGVLADINIGLGRNEEARTELAAIAGAPAPDVYALAAYADFLLDAGRPRDVLELLEGKGTSDALLLRCAIAAKQAGDARLGQWSKILGERFSAAAAAGVRVHLREEARYRLEVEEDISAALPLAIENWNIQKEPADAVILIRSALSAATPAAARPVIDHVKATGLKDKRIDPLLTQLEAKQ